MQSHALPGPQPRRDKTCPGKAQSSLFMCEDPEGGETGGPTPPPPPPESSQNYMVSLDPLIIHKATCNKPAFYVGSSSARERSTI